MPYRQHHGFIFSKGIKILPSKASKRMQELHFPMLFSTYKKMGDSEINAPKSLWKGICSQTAHYITK